MRPPILWRIADARPGSCVNSHPQL